MFFTGNSNLSLPCERFTVIYRVFGSEKEAYQKAKDICVEQTVEFPAELVPEGVIADNILGKIESFEAFDEKSYRVTISYPVDGAAYELTQLLNIMFGNISMKPGIRLEDADFPKSILERFKGPRFGVKGLRKLLAVEERPLLFTALKPMGLTNEELADLAYKFAIGGIDVIKDDHGLSNQPFSAYVERVKLCAEAIHKANKETGNNCIYMPNVSAPFGDIVYRSRIAKDLGAGGLLIAPGLTGLDAMRVVAEDDSIGLPVISHPAFQGSYLFGDSGISHQMLLGKLARMAGADGTIYPNFGGRFSFTVEECKSIAKAASAVMGELKPIFICPAGGMSLESIPESLKVYGNDVMFLIGGGLFRHGPDIVESSRYFKSLVAGK